MGMVKDELIWQEERCHHDEVLLSDCMEDACSLRDVRWCRRSRASLRGDRRTADVPTFLRIAADLDPHGLCAPPIGDQLALVLPRVNALLRAMSRHDGEIPVGRGLFASVSTGPLSATGLELDPSPWVRALAMTSTVSSFHLARAESDPCHLVRLAVALNPSSSLDVLELLGRDPCTTVASTAMHVLGRDGRMEIEPTAFLLRAGRCDCTDDCRDAALPISPVPSLEVSERALDILIRLATASPSVDAVRPTGSGSGLGWAFGVCEGTSPGELLLLVDADGRVRRPDQHEWQDLPADEAVAWAASRTLLPMTRLPVALRLAILLGSDAMPDELTATIARAGHLLLADGVATRLRPACIDGLPSDPHDPASALGSSSDWIIEVAHRERTTGMSPFGHRVETEVFDLRQRRAGLEDVLARVTEAVEEERAPSERSSTRLGGWRSGRIPLSIDRFRTVVPYEGEDAGLVIESASDPEDRCLAVGVHTADAADPDLAPLADGPLLTGCGFGRTVEQVLVVEDSDEVGALLGVPGPAQSPRGTVRLIGQPIGIDRVGTFIRTATGWFVLRELVGEDGRWLSGYAQDLDENLVRELAAFRSMVSPHVPAPSEGATWGSAHELASFVGGRDDAHVVGFRYEFAIGGVIDAERRGWAWTRCAGAWRDCELGDAEGPHGCEVPAGESERHVVQPWAFPDVLRIWDRGGRIPTVLAATAARGSSEALGSVDLRPVDLRTVEELLDGAAARGHDPSDLEQVRRRVAGAEGSTAQDFLSALVRLIDLAG